MATGFEVHDPPETERQSGEGHLGGDPYQFCHADDLTDARIEELAHQREETGDPAALARIQQGIKDAREAENFIH